MCRVICCDGVVVFVCFFFKQKTAYEMRISDWSSDVCSSDLPTPRAMGDLFRLMYTSGTTDRPKGVMHTYENFYVKSAEHVIVFGLTAETRLLVTGPLYHVGAFDQIGRASCRERVCQTCRSRWSPYH